VQIVKGKFVTFFHVDFKQTLFYGEFSLWNHVYYYPGPGYLKIGITGYIPLKITNFE
jgi:hypothetical protein